jgi:hypothetical protein
MADGQPLPPLIEDDVVWRIVRRARGFTLWRRIFLQSSPVTDWRTAPGDQSRAPNGSNPMMDMRQYAGESFIKVADVKNDPLKEQIAVIKNGKWDRPNLVFESGNLLSLNATNTRTLVRAYGPNGTDWIGKQIELYLGQVETKDGLADSVLVRPVSPPLKSAEQTKLAPVEAKPEQKKPKAPKYDPDHPFNDPTDDLGR